MRMELRQLEYFLACCDQGTFTAAARSLHVVQSAVSTGVAKLEHELGAKLFDRTRTVLVLTDAGRAAMAPAREALRARDEVRDAIAGMRGEVRGEVVLGALVNVATINLAGAFEVVHRRHPGISIAMRQSPQGSAGNVRHLRNGSLDLTLLGGRVRDLSGITSYALAAEPLVLVTHPDHRLARAGRFAADDLADERVIDYPPGWGTRTIIDAEIPTRHSVIEVADQVFGIQLARSGFGVTAVPASVAADQSGAGIVPCVDRDLTWVIYVAHSATRSLTRRRAPCWISFERYAGRLGI
ncbi:MULTISPECIES: LysR family transcriptional regulator [Gordonia]|uniref:LysR family transcriptional regulator n=2 Tax=Gordoniaceae TaxID=85026 RepID=UPI001E4F8155|nr:LysR family transcriptional regulator [Gordonia sp. 852002-51296_SCH5728562-b]